MKKLDKVKKNSSVWKNNIKILFSVNNNFKL